MKRDSNSRLGERFEQALLYAVRKHAGQVRKHTDIPYICHLLAAAGLVMEFGGAETEVIAALLHDAAEDQGGTETLAEIRAQFGDAVADIVADCSDDMPEEESKKRPWPERKTEHIAHLRDASRSVLLVSMADKIHNLRTILTDLEVLSVTEMWQRFNATPAESLWYYRSLLDIFARCDAQPALPLAMVRLMQNLVASLGDKIAAGTLPDMPKGCAE